MTHPTNNSDSTWVEDELDLLCGNAIDWAQGNIGDENHEKYHAQAKQKILQKMNEARGMGQADIYSWVISSHEDGEDLENIVSESKTRLKSLEKEGT